MSITAPDHHAWTTGLSAASAPAPRSDARGFSSLLTRASSSSVNAGKTDAQRVRETVEQFVASAFLTPLLNEVRDQPLDSDLFHGGFAEDSFRQQLDTILADRMVAGGNFPLVDSIYQRVMANVNAQTAPTRLDLAA